MSDATPKNRDSFQRASADKPIVNPDGSPLRDKDNAAPQHKPAYPTRPAPNLAPAGAMGIRVGLPPKGIARTQHNSAGNKPSAGLAITDDRADDGPWTEGRIITMPGYSFMAKLHDAPSPSGLDQGKIAKLQVLKDGKQVMHYDRGWDQAPATAHDKEALLRIRKGLGDEPAKTIKAPDWTQSRTPDLDR